MSAAMHPPWPALLKAGNMTVSAARRPPLAAPSKAGESVRDEWGGRPTLGRMQDFIRLASSLRDRGMAFGMGGVAIMVVIWGLSISDWIRLGTDQVFDPGSVWTAPDPAVFGRGETLFVDPWNAAGERLELARGGFGRERGVRGLGRLVASCCARHASDQGSPCQVIDARCDRRSCGEGVMVLLVSLVVGGCGGAG